MTDLIGNVDDQLVKIRTRSNDVSFNELYDMYNNSELIINPEYQRLFRWDEGKQSRFIESIILEMPVPPIFAIEKDSNVYELIDGLQRISTYLHFRGLKTVATDEPDEPDENNADHLILQGCDIVPALNGLSFDNLPKPLQIKIKRSFVRMEVIKKESEESLKYHMFKRLNTGGELLSDQEIRNCTIRLLGAEAIDFIKECSKNESFVRATGRMSSEKLKMSYNHELVLRFFAIKNDLESYKNPVSEYLTGYLEKITEKKIIFDFDKERQIFNSTFEFINKNFEDAAFSGRNLNGAPSGEFRLYYFDGIAIAVASLINRVKAYPNTNAVVEGINKVKYGEELRPYTTGRSNSVRKRIQLFMEGVQKILDDK